MSRADELIVRAKATKGFMPDDEGRALIDAGRLIGTERPRGTWLEVGAWCGKSSVYLGIAAEECHAVLYSLDHHRGSEENQAGWEHHDASLIDPADGRLNTLPTWQRTIADTHLEETVVGLVGESSVVAGHFANPLDLLFIDGGHGSDVAWRDYRGWSPKVSTGGLLLIHDVFPDPRDGGRPPFEIYSEALESGDFREESSCGSLRVLRAISSFR